MSHDLHPLDVAVFDPLKANWRQILLRFYRESYVAIVSKPVFPSLLKQLCNKLQPTNLVGGFRGAGLWPFNPDAVRGDKIIETGEQHPSSSQTHADSPRKLLQEAIVKAIAPALSETTNRPWKIHEKRGNVCRPLMERF